MKLRKCDAQGCGHWQAPRGSRKHNGIDVVCQTGECVESITDGIITKIGYPYNPNSSKGHFRYVEVTDANKARIRYFYVKPDVNVGKTVIQGEVIGKAQNIEEVYKGITPHFHLEVIAFCNPIDYLKLDVN